MSIDVREFLSAGWPSREISLKYHVQGIKASIKCDYEEICYAVKPSIEEALWGCIKSFEEAMKIKMEEKIKRLQTRKKELQKEIEEVSYDINSMKLNSFKAKK